MDRDTWLAYFENAPAPVRFYLMDPQSKEYEAQAQQALAYDYDAWVRLMDLVWELVFEHLPKLEFREQLKPLIGARKLEDVERELLLRVVLPIADMVAWDVDSRLLELGVSSTILQNTFRVSLRPVSYGAAARRIANLARMSVLTEEVARRLREVLVSYIKGVRGIDDVKMVLTRTQEGGGLGFTQEQAQEYTSQMDQFLSSTQVMSEEAFANWFANYQREMSALQASRDHAPLASKAAPSTEEEEIAAHALGTPTKTDSSLLQQAIQSALTRVELPTLDDYLLRRLENIVSTRLRDVRNTLQVKEVLQRDAKVGGVGLDEGEAERVTNIIETVYLETRTQIATEEKQKIDTITQEQQLKIDERRKRESEEHAEWYQSKVRDQGPDSGVEALKALREQSMQPGTARSLSQPSAAMDGVRAPTRLTGLSEELGMFTLADFRRLGRTPEQTTEKLKQKFDTLKNESFERWTEAIQAWRKSPLQQLYLTLVADSFATGKPVAQLAEERRQQNQEVPTPEELGAILLLNNMVQL